MPIYRFGDFEIDSRSGELRRQGSRVRLRPQPAAVLQHLVERPYELVSRQEIRQLLWPDGTFVQFDDGLNSCIKQIRAALRDDRARPHYVETLSRRGYRFIAPVEAADDGERPLHLRVAVAPFQGLTTDQETREIADGLTAELTTQLAIAGRNCGVAVVTRLAAAPGTEPLTAPSADFELTGSVRLSRGRVRVAVQLVDARTQAHTWAEMFDAQLDDLLRAQTALAAAIVEGVLPLPGHHTPEKGQGSTKSSALIASASV